jgi:hypothetical protein
MAPKRHPKQNRPIGNTDQDREDATNTVRSSPTTGTTSTTGASTNTNSAISSRDDDPTWTDIVAVALSNNADRTKFCLYKLEPNMTRIKRPALELITVTTAIFIKTLVVGIATQTTTPACATTAKALTGELPSNTTSTGLDKRPPRRSKRRLSSSPLFLSSPKKKAPRVSESLLSRTNPVLVTLDMIKRHVSGADNIATIPTVPNHPTSSAGGFEFLVQSLRGIRERGSSSSTPFVSSNTSKRKKKKKISIPSAVTKKSIEKMGVWETFKTDTITTTAAASDEFPVDIDDSQRIIQADESDYD